MSDHRQHSSMMVRPPRRESVTEVDTSTGSVAMPAAAPVHGTDRARAEDASRAVGLFGKFFHHRRKPD